MRGQLHRCVLCDKCIEAHVLGGRKGSRAPLLELEIELLVEFGDIALRDLEAAQLFHDSGDAAGADSFGVHGGDDRFEGSIGARASLE